MKKIFLLLPGILVFALFFPVNAKTLDLKKAENFSLNSYDGEKHSLDSYKNSKAIVLMFVATRCPVSNAYNSRMAELYNEYHHRGIAFLGVNSNKLENVAEIKEHAQENKFGFPVLKDPENRIADKFGASVTPEVYVLNPDWEVVYHGRIDDAKKMENVKSHDLKNALDEVLAGKDVTTSHTKAFGCSIKRVGK